LNSARSAGYHGGDDDKETHMAQPDLQVLPTGRKQDLIDATMRTIAEHGLSNVTLAKVAALAGCTPAAVSFHFNSKEALLTATLRQVAEEFEHTLAAAIAQAGDDPGRALEALLDVCMGEQLTAPRKVAVWYAFLSEGSARADYQQLCGTRDDWYFETILDLCRKVIAQADPPRPPDALAVAYGLVGLIDSLWQEILFTGDSYDRVAGRRTCQAYLASVFPWRFEMPSAQAAAPPAAEAPAEDPQLVWTLPSWVYENDEFAALEHERVFMPAWQLVCHVSELPNPGDYVTCSSLGQRAFVIRDTDGTIRAFHNVCAHRAHAVVQGASGHCDGYMRCPYHGWTYHLDGSNRSVSAPHTFAKFDTRAFGLKPIDLEIFMGFVFIRYRSGGPGVAERFAPYVEEMAHYRFEDMVPCSELWEEDADVDWKNAVENYVEDYHFPIGHPGLSALAEREYDRAIDLERGVLRLSHAMRDQPLPNWSARKYSKLLPRQPHLPPHMQRRWTYFGLLPNAFFDVYPDQMDVFIVQPLGPGRLRLRSRAYCLPDDSREARVARYLNLRLNRRVQDEDSSLTASVQVGLRSMAYERGILSEKEVIVRGFQDWLRAILPEANSREPLASRVRPSAHSRAGIAACPGVAGPAR
jgi:phenylpropionate dioxygenase-like ring-hydroxylating dioxygenase large terminal subunit/AcrR family transcriptional regulator